ncbi:MAG: hypothetical protein HQL95_10105 [Magnetococcales bacterium]|nr:hypothetical protein [Magnetococcales bacterium]
MSAISAATAQSVPQYKKPLSTTRVQQQNANSRHSVIADSRNAQQAANRYAVQKARSAPPPDQTSAARDSGNLPRDSVHLSSQSAANPPPPKDAQAAPPPPKEPPPPPESARNGGIDVVV